MWTLMYRVAKEVIVIWTVTNVCSSILFDLFMNNYGNTITEGEVEANEESYSYIHKI